MVPCIINPLTIASRFTTSGTSTIVVKCLWHSNLFSLLNIWEKQIFSRDAYLLQNKFVGYFT